MPEIVSSENIDCSNLSFVTSLTSPVATAVASLSSGDILNVELTAPSSLRIFDSNGILVGSLLTIYRDAIISCMNKGTSFIAIVIKVNGGNCDVRVKAK